MNTAPPGNTGDGSPPLETTASLLDRARTGDGRALETLLDRYRAPLTRWASGRLPARARGAIDTEDLVQDALVQCLKRLDRFEPRWRGAFHGYLRKAVMNKLKDQVRRAEIGVRARDRADVLPAAETSPLEQVIGLEALDRYEAALSRLPERDRDLLVARIEMNLGYGELAEMHGRSSADAARMSVKRALMRLAREMGAPPHG